MLSDNNRNLQNLKLLDIIPKNINIWKEALVHKSWNFYAQKNYPHNERLEFLGDAVLELIVSEELFRKYSHLSEGDLTLIRSLLVRRERLAGVAKNLNLDKILLFDPRLPEKGKLTILGDALEAVIGALYLDSGLEAARNFVKKYLLKDLDEIVSQHSLKDPKTILQEKTQDKFNTLPVYRVVKESGAEHNKIFYVEVFLNDKKIGKGKGTSKQKAEINAALDALKNLKWQ